MKTLVNFLLVALTLGCFSRAQAETHKPIGGPKKAAAFQTGIYTTSEGKLQIALRKQTGGTVRIRLVNSAGVELLYHKIGKRREATRLRLDVSALPDGLYRVEITNGLETTTREVTLAATHASVAPRLIAIN
ncbi:hypothetical protein GCM10027299_11220 [Larkinella ripae]